MITQMGGVCVYSADFVGPLSVKNTEDRTVSIWPRGVYRKGLCDSIEPAQKKRNNWPNCP